MPLSTNKNGVGNILPATKTGGVDVSRRKITSSLVLSAGLLGGCAAAGSRTSSRKTNDTSGQATTRSISTNERRGYEIIDPPLSATAGNGSTDSAKVEVSFLFAYLCPPCYDVAKDLTPWAAANSEVVNYSQEVTPLNSDWERDARLYYTLKQTQRSQQFINSVYARAESDKSWLRSNILMAQRVKSMDSSINEGEFLETMYSNEVEAKLERSRIFAQRSGIRAIPSVIVNGKYRLDPGITGGLKNVVRVVDALVKYEIEQGDL